MVVVIDASVPGSVAHLRPEWRKCLTMTIRPTSTIVLIGLSETNTIGYYKTAFNLSQYRDFVYSVYRSFVIKRNLSFVHGQQTWKGEERKHDNVLSRLPIFTIYCFP